MGNSGPLGGTTGALVFKKNHIQRCNSVYIIIIIVIILLTIFVPYRYILRWLFAIIDFMFICKNEMLI